IDAVLSGFGLRKRPGHRYPRTCARRVRIEQVRPASRTEGAMGPGECLPFERQYRAAEWGRWREGGLGRVARCVQNRCAAVPSTRDRAPRARVVMMAAR